MLLHGTINTKRDGSSGPAAAQARLLECLGNKARDLGQRIAMLEKALVQALRSGSHAASCAPGGLQGALGVALKDGVQLGPRLLKWAQAATSRARAARIQPR